MAKAISSEERLFRIALQKVRDEWGSNYRMIGDRFFRALLCEEVLWLVVQNVDEANIDTVKRIVEHGWKRAFEESTD